MGAGALLLHLVRGEELKPAGVAVPVLPVGEAPVPLNAAKWQSEDFSAASAGEVIGAKGSSRGRIRAAAAAARAEASEPGSPEAARHDDDSCDSAEKRGSIAPRTKGRGAYVDQRFQ